MRAGRARLCSCSVGLGGAALRGAAIPEGAQIVQGLLSRLPEGRVAAGGQLADAGERERVQEPWAHQGHNLRLQQQGLEQAQGVEADFWVTVS